MATSIIISLCADCQCLLQALTCTSQNSVWLALTIACLHLPVDVVLTMPSHSLLVLASVSCESSLLRYSIYSYHYSLSPIDVLLAPTLPGRSLLALASVCCKSRHESWIEVAGSSSRLTHHPIHGQMGKDDSACPSGDAIIIIDEGQRACYCKCVGRMSKFLVLFISQSYQTDSRRWLILLRLKVIF